MNARLIAARLKVAGVAVQGVTEGDDSVDGEVVISALIHVQVPTFGGYPGVVIETNDGCFRFLPERKSISALVTDVRVALGMF